MSPARRAAALLVGVLALACSASHGGSGGGACVLRRTDYKVGNGASAVVIADLNGDGKPDLAVTNNTDGTVSVLLGTGGGAFGAPVTYATRLTPYSVAAADVNGDGKLDLVVGNGDGVGGTGGDGISVLLGNGDGTFQAKVDSPAVPDSCPDADGVAVGDFNGDGKLDVVVANDLQIGIGKMSLLLGNGSAAFTLATGAPWTAGNAPESVAVGDFNHDGKLDVAVANTNSSSVMIFLGDGAGGFAAPVPYVATGAPYFVVARDLNGDGRLDLVTANSLGDGVSVLLGNGDGTFKPEVRYGAGVGSAPNAVAVADVNGDGKPDLVTANNGTDGVSVFLGNGNGTFQPAMSYGAGQKPFGIAAGDLDGNGLADVAVANWNSGTVTVLLTPSCP
jgi:hypothetical protein